MRGRPKIWTNAAIDYETAMKTLDPKYANKSQHGGH